MQLFFFFKTKRTLINHEFTLILTALILFGYVGCQSQTSDRLVAEAETSAFGIVSGTVFDQISNQPVPNSNVTFSDQTVITDPLGRYVLRQVPYGKHHSISVASDDYQTINLEFDLVQDYLPLNISLVRTNDVEQEIRRYFDRLSNLVANMEKVEEIEGHFSPNYVVSEDVVTQFGVGAGVIPADFTSVKPTFRKLFTNYDKIQFQFDHIKIHAHHAREASSVLQLVIVTEKGPRRKKMLIQTNAKINFEKWDGIWQTHFLQLLEVHLNP